MTASSQQSSPESPKGWEIIPSCDIKLGVVFSQNPDLKDQTLEINTDSITRILHHLAPDSGGVLHFAAVHGDSLGNDENDIRYNRKTSTLLGSAKKISEGVFSCLIGIGGGAHYGIRFGEPDKSGLKKEDNKDIEKIIVAARGLQATATTSSIQETTIHELTHVTDLSNEHLENMHNRQKKLELYQQRVALLGSVALPAYLAQDYVDKLPLIPESIVVKIIAGIVGGITGLYIYGDKIVTRIANKNYRGRLLEKRANESAEENIKKFPRVIRFKNIPTN